MFQAVDISDLKLSKPVAALVVTLGDLADDSGAVALPIGVAMALAGVSVVGSLRRLLAPVKASGVLHYSIDDLDPAGPDYDPGDPFGDGGAWLFVWFRASMVASNRARILDWADDGGADSLDLDGDGERASAPISAAAGGEVRASALDSVAGGEQMRASAPIGAADGGQVRASALDSAGSPHTHARAGALFVSDLFTDQLDPTLSTDTTNKQASGGSAWDRRRASSARVAAVSGTVTDSGEELPAPGLARAIRLLTSPGVGLPVAQARRLAASYLASGLEFGDLLGSVLQWDRQRGTLQNPAGALVSRLRAGWLGDYKTGDENGALWKFADLDWPAAADLDPVVRRRRFGEFGQVAGKTF